MNAKTALAALGASALTAIGLTMNSSEAAYDPLTKLDMDFIKYVAKYNKSYETKQEFAERSDIYKKNMAEVEAINSDPNMTHTAGENHLSDWSLEELQRILMKIDQKFLDHDGGYPANTEHKPRVLASEFLPKKIDWDE